VYEAHEQHAIRTERNKDGSWNVWLSQDEYQALSREAETFEREVAIRLMADCWLRVREVLDSESTITDTCKQPGSSTTSR
jgi:hypothetical protein